MRHNSEPVIEKIGIRSAVYDEAVAAGLTDCLSSLKSDPQQWRVALDGFETVILDTQGDGEPVLLLHSLGCDHWMWAPLLARLSRHHRVLALDMRFHGAAAGAPLPSSLDELARDAIAILDALGISRAIVGGLSMGGAVAQHLALLAPERVSRLWLIATVAKGFPAMIDRAEAGERDGVTAQIPGTLERWFSRRSLAANGWAVCYARQSIASMTSRDWAGAWRGLATLSSFDRLRQISMPTTLVAGAEDASATPELMLAMANRIPKARFEMLLGVYHMVALEAPEELAELLLKK